MCQNVCDSGESTDNIKEWDRKHDSSVKRDIILDAAEQVFSDKDYHEAVLDEVADVAGVSKATLYLYFKNKIDLFLSVAERKLCELNEVILKSTADCSDPVATIKRLITDELTFFSDNAAFFKVIHDQRFNLQLRAQVNEDEIRERVMPLMFSKINVTAEVIKLGQENGVFQAVNPKEAAFMLTSLVHTCLLLLNLAPEDVVLTDKAELVEKIFLEGLLMRKT
ncbi:TPA: TetR/AcrR family transcriptional regulator [Candidatus Poribacteria bacterium]|nr:TetR/AcrR family transcriptional regulator [Candidatus Poribacteria bacterium]